jgi:inner membrane protein
MTSDKNETGEPQSAAPTRAKTVSFGENLITSPSVKLIIISIVTMLLLIPSTFVWVLVDERADRAREVALEIQGSWGGSQEINGPYLVVPFSETVTTMADDEPKTMTRWRRVVLFPEKLDATGDIKVEERKRSIYTLPVYKSRLDLRGRFAPPPERAFEPREGGTIEIAADKAELVIGIGDIRALKSDAIVTLGGARSIAFEPGLGELNYKNKAITHTGRSGINAPVPPASWRSGFAFDIPLQFNGSTAIYLAPAGQTTKAAITSDWPHPGFAGAFLPETRDISDTGFTAEWTIPYLARGLPKFLETTILPLQSTMLGVKFVEPVDFYQTISRSLKYAIGFFSLTFLAVFMLEMSSSWRFHWIQYGLVGLALVVFYVMLLALAEHIGYARAYLVAACAATALNAAYVGSSLKSWVAGAVMLTVLASIYAVLYALMREQDYALLIGSIIAFIALAITMFATQRIDWSGQRHKAVDARPAAA